MPEARDVRASITRAEATSRIIKNRKSTKTWIQDDNTNLIAAAGDARERNIDPEQAKRMVSCVTRFATSMCVLIAALKIVVYLRSGAAVVKTSALDSMGDLLANMITLYTGFKMMSCNMSQYPLGNSKFESIGVLIFSTLMAAMMFANFLENLEGFFDEGEKAREDAVEDFWRALFGKREEVHNTPVWNHPGPGFLELKKLVPVTSNVSTFFKLALGAEATDFDAATESVRDLMERVAEKVSDIRVWEKLVFQNIFLGICATYKCCLWCFCTFVAVPRTGSTVLVALANDKRNDFIATSFVICSTFFAYGFQDTLNAIVEDGADKIDPLCALILCSVIIYTWVSLAGEQVRLLCMRTVEPDILEAVDMTIKKTLHANGNYEFDNMKAYYSSAKYTVEFDLHVEKPETPFFEVADTVGHLQAVLSKSESVERTIIVPVTG